MAYEIHSDLKPLSANLKRLNVGKSFRLKDFEYELEENEFDAFWKICIKESGYITNILSSNQDEIYSEFFVIGLNTIYRKYINANVIDKIKMKILFNSFFNICFIFFLKNNKRKIDFSKIIEIINNLEIFKKDIISLIQVENETSKFVDTEIKFDRNKLIINSNTEKKYQIFISSTFTDLINERQASVEAILKKGHIPAGMELFSANNKSQWEVIKKWIDDSDVYVLLLGGRYGSIDKETGLSYTEKEYNYAVQKGKPLFALILDDKIIFDKSLEITKDYDLKVQKYIDFKEKVASKMCAFPKNIDQIKLEIINSLDTIILENSNKMVGWVKGNVYENIDFIQHHENAKK